MERNEFGHESLRILIGKAESSGYTFVRFDDSRNVGRRFYLRLDVDISPPSAKALGRVISDSGTVANFFFLIDGETYNIFDESVISTIGELRALGHCVGLHVDQNTFGDDETKIRNTINWFTTSVAAIDPVVSFHRPTPSVLNHSFGSFLSAYDPQFFPPTAMYLSDSRFSGSFEEPLIECLQSAEKDLQLLIHPEWWANESDPREILSAVRSRRQSELDHYMDRCFNKVFGEFIAHEDRHFRL